MKISMRSTLLIALFGTAPVFAAEMGDMKMKEQAMGIEAAQPAHKASGTVKAIDAAKGTITIAHGAVPSANWPAMEMAFNITPSMIGEIKAEQQVVFEFVSKGMEATVTKIAGVK